MTGLGTSEIGHQAARFEAVALPFMTALYNKAFRLTQRPDNASDLVQETYLRAYRTFSNFEEGTNCKAWLFTIMYSIFVNKYRKEQREPNTVSFDELEGRFQQVVREDRGASTTADFSMGGLDWKEQEVDDALSEIPESFRSAILLVDVEEFSYEEAASILNCPVGTLRSRLARARKMLFVKLHDYALKTGYIKGVQS